MKKILYTLNLIMCFNALHAQEPTAEEVVEKYLITMGGGKFWKNIESTRQIGTVSIEGMDLPCMILQARPNLMYIELTLDTVNNQKIVDAFDGKTAWAKNPFTLSLVPIIKDSIETKEVAADAFEDELVDYEAKGHKIRLDSTEIINGKSCFRLVLSRKAGDEKVFLINTENFSLMVIRSFVGGKKENPIELYLNSYKEVAGGLLLPKTMEVMVNGEVMRSIKIDKVEVNPTFDKKIFSPVY
jgi:outer membrane lipoprotein-sorting protein